MLPSSELADNHPRIFACLLLFGVPLIYFARIFNYCQPRMDKTTSGERLLYLVFTSTCLFCSPGVFNNLRSPNFVPGLDDNENAMECDCHPTCADVTYSTEISESNFFKSEYDQTNFL